MLVLAVRCSEVKFEVGPSLVRCFFLVPPATGAQKVACWKELGIDHFDLLSMANCHASCLREVRTILNLLEQGLHWLLGIPCLAHLLEIVFQINSCDDAVSKKISSQASPWM
jgi:hypothetical protein